MASKEMVIVTVTRSARKKKTSTHVREKKTSTHVRKKAWRPKVRTGCVTCRIRRVKCDEGKPHCHRCTSTGRKCDGYNSTSAPSSPPQSQVAASAPTGPRSPVPARLPIGHPCYQVGSLEEQQNFHFFLKCTAAELSGYFDSAFWQHQILQASHVFVGIRHALVGIGAMHRKYIEGDKTVVPDDSSDRQYRFALEQCNKAIREIVNTSTQRSISDKITMMSACILFESIACLQGHQQVAMEHLRNGLRLLKEVDDELEDSAVPTGTHPVALSTVRSMLITMDVQARSIMSNVSLHSWEPYPKGGVQVDQTPFCSFRQARTYFEAILNRLQALLHDIGFNVPSENELPRMMAEYTLLIEQFNAGSLLLEDFLERHKDHLEEEERTVLSIRIVHQHLRYFLNTFKYWDGKREFDWGVDETHFGRILELGTRLLELEKQTGPTGENNTVATNFSLSDALTSRGNRTSRVSRPIFVSGSVLCYALWTVACRPRDPRLRRTAISMLLSQPRREGVWDGVLAGRIAQETLNLEIANALDEMGPEKIDPSEIVRLPEHLQCRDVAITYTGDRAARIEIRSIAQCRRKEPGAVRYLNW